MIYSRDRAFAALKTDGSVVTWGNSDYGGDSSSVSSSLSSGVSAIYSNSSVFAAVKTDGSVVTWGYAERGGHLGKIYDRVNSEWILVSDVSSDLTSGVSKIFSTGSAFAAVKTDGSVVTWGYAEWGGDSSSVANQLNP